MTTAAYNFYCLGTNPSLTALLLIQDKLVPIDSFITSPSWPVRINLPEPGYFVVSISKALPPFAV
jgi:hypothetical protein